MAQCCAVIITLTSLWDIMSLYDHEFQDKRKSWSLICPPTPSLSVWATPSHVLLQGSEATLHCEVSGPDPQAQAQWTKPDGNTLGSGLAQLKPVSSSDAGTWKCSFSSGKETYNRNLDVTVKGEHVTSARATVKKKRTNIRSPYSIMWRSLCWLPVPTPTTPPPPTNRGGSKGVNNPSGNGGAYSCDYSCVSAVWAHPWLRHFLYRHVSLSILSCRHCLFSSRWYWPAYTPSWIGGAGAHLVVVGCDRSRLPGRGRPVDPRHLLLQEEQEKESEHKEIIRGNLCGLCCRFR